SVCESVQEHQGGDAGRKLHECLLAGRLDPGELLGHVLAGRTDAIHARVEALGLDAGLTSTILRLLMIPVLGPVNRAWLPLRRGVAWHEGFCPTCGSWPLLAELRGPGQSRFLRCGLCAAEWEFPPPNCPFCGLDDPVFLGHLDSVGEDPRYRAVTCDACRRYLKTVATPGPLSGPQLLVAD